MNDGKKMWDAWANGTLHCVVCQLALGEGDEPPFRPGETVPTKMLDLGRMAKSDALKVALIGAAGLVLAAVVGAILQPSWWSKAGSVSSGFTIGWYRC